VAPKRAIDLAHVATRITRGLALDDAIGVGDRQGRGGLGVASEGPAVAPPRIRDLNLAFDAGLERPAVRTEDLALVDAAGRHAFLADRRGLLDKEVGGLVALADVARQELVDRGGHVGHRDLVDGGRILNPEDACKNSHWSFSL